MRIREPNFGNPVFLTALSLLILNDWYLKPVFHNQVTGKLSDFAGLLAFPFFLSIVFPSGKKVIHVVTAILFITWKSELVQPFIDLVNHLGIPIERTLDYSDLWALVCVPISYLIVYGKECYKLKPITNKLTLVVSLMAFVATTLPPSSYKTYADINKIYSFKFSKRELISRLNMVQLAEVRSINKFSKLVDFDSERNVFHYHGSTDTLVHLIDSRIINDQDTIRLKTTFADIRISGDSLQSQLILISAYNLELETNKKDHRAKVIRQFEKRVVKKIKRYGFKY